MFKNVVVGGTFNILHRGHEKLLKTAILIGRTVTVGLTSDEFANRFRASVVFPYSQRKEKLNEMLKKLIEETGRTDVITGIVEISDNYGHSTLDPGIDAIVVSEETLLRAEEINAIRFKKKLNKLVIVVIPIITTNSGVPLSSETPV